jgi:sugar phosphate isomerase/epimerase
VKTIKGPALFLAQFMDDKPPFNTLENICRWAADLVYKCVQIPTWDSRLMDLEKAAESKSYCDDWKGQIKEYGLEVTELSTHLQGQLVAVHPIYDQQFDGFAPEAVHNNPKARTEWAVQQLKWAAAASRNLGLSASVSFSGSLLWPFVFPWPQRPDGLVEEGFTELANRWRPILDVYEEQGVDLCYEIHPGEDLHDGISYERFLQEVDNHPRACINYDPSHFVLQALDHLAFIDIYHEKIKAFHVKDGEFNPDGRQGVYGGFEPWPTRAGRFRSLGDGQVDFKGIFSKLTQYDYGSWAVLEWECVLKSPEQGAREGVSFIQEHIIEATTKSFDDFAGQETDREMNRKLLGLGN